MRTKAMGLMVFVVACAGEKLDVGDDPAAGAGGTSGVMSSGATSGTSAGNNGTAADFGGGTGGGGTSALGGGTGGSGTTGGTGGAGTGGVLPSPPAQDGCESDPKYAGLLGTWEGQTEDFYLQPVRSVRVIINGAGPHGICGSVTWGDVEAPPPATDPDAVYPDNGYFAEAGFGGQPGVVPVDGFEYTIDQGATRDRTVRFSVQQFEPWRSWCEIQTSTLTNEGYNCMNLDGEYTITSDPYGTCLVGPATYTVFKCTACGRGTNVCACDANGCTSAQERPVQYDLTLSDDGKVLSGPAGDYARPDVAFHLEHVE